jgi:hypothetical protein
MLKWWYFKQKKGSTLEKRKTFNPDDLALNTAPARSASVVSSTLSPSSSSYCIEQHQILAGTIVVYTTFQKSSQIQFNNA